MARIPDHFIQDLLARTDLVELVNSRVPLKKTGRNYSACCPFHQEKTPSFSVAPDKQFYYCFGCGANGNAVGFLMEYERLSFPEAVEQLANRVGMDVPKEEGPRAEQSRQHRDRLQVLYDLLARAERFYSQQLKSAPEKKVAVDYLKGRGLSGEIAKRYGLGYAPPGFDNLMTGLSLDNAGVEQALTAGLLVRREDNNRTYDKFRDRIIFPIRDSRGRTIGFGGRVLGDGKPKYLNSPETPVFHKGQELYGLWEWRQSKEKSTRLIIVEGYMDVIALAQSGIDNALATLGTATTEEHAVKIFRQVDEVVFCFDGDKAGRRAAWRALESALPALEDGKQARFLFLPDGEDPDTLVREQGREEFLLLADKAPTLSEYLFNHLSDGLPLDSVDSRARLAKLAMPYIEKVRGDLYKKLLRRELADLTRLHEDDLIPLAKAPASPPPAQRASAPKAQHDAPDYDDYMLQAGQGYDDHGHYPPPDHESEQGGYDEPAAPQNARHARQNKGSTHFNLSERLLLTLIDYPEVLTANPLPADIEELNEPQLDLLVEIAAMITGQPNISTPDVLGSLMAMEQGELVAEAMRRAVSVPKDPQRGMRTWQDGICALEIRYLEQRHHQARHAAAPDIRQLAEINQRLAEVRAKQRMAHEE
ncbi:MAG: DNA primase [Alcanivoracaceae bacterium]|nr:DNA primase [Alcanivoracaceae bacterium]